MLDDIEQGGKKILPRPLRARICFYSPCEFVKPAEGAEGVELSVAESLTFPVNNCRVIRIFQCLRPDRFTLLP